MAGRISVWISGTQLLEKHPALEYALATSSKRDLRVLLIESQQIIQERPGYAGKKVLILSAMRHYADWLRQAGHQVDYLQAASIKEGIETHLNNYQPDELVSMASSDYTGRQFQQKVLPKLGDQTFTTLANTQFLTERFNPFPDHPAHKTIRQESFYRRMRTHFGILLDKNGKPLGGKWNFDMQNRQKLPSDLDPAQIKSFPSDRITKEVINELQGHGLVKHSLLFELAVDHTGAKEALDDFILNRLNHFGTYQDAMTTRSAVVYHSLLSPYLNIGLLDPLETIQAVEQAYHQGDVPLNSAEGFIRQVLGWREYMYWHYWQGNPALLEMNHFQAQHQLPDFFWTGKTDLFCLASSINKALETGYNHHIERLMILGNFCTLAGIQPRQVLDWFNANYLDAYPWVMAPNLLGMGLYADGGIIGSKPYISSANYIHKMSDYCGQCRYQEKKRVGEKACPFNYLYWNFLLSHRDLLSANPRMNLSLKNLERIKDEELKDIREHSANFLSHLPAESK